MSNQKRDSKDSSSGKKTNLGTELRPQLLWPKFCRLGDGFDEDDDSVFCKESKDVIGQRREFREIQDKMKFSPGSNTFWNCFRYSNDIVLVDKFFDEYAYNRMMFELKEVLKSRDKRRKKIRIYCSDNHVKIKNLNEEIREDDTELLNYFSVSINRIGRHNSTHDRFAIMDGEIWHCGAAVGGMHAELSALSRGWKDENDNLKKYFCGEEGEYDT